MGKKVDWQSYRKLGTKHRLDMKSIYKAKSKINVEAISNPKLTNNDAYSGSDLNVDDWLVYYVFVLVYLFWLLGPGNRI